MSALSKRLATALAAARATRKTPPKAIPAKPERPLNIRRMIVALVQGQTPDEVEIALSSLRKIAVENDYGIVIVTDSQEIALFQQPDCVTEFLPSAAQLGALSTAHDPAIYLQNRLAILLRKWEPVQVLPFGPEAMASFAALQGATAA